MAAEMKAINLGGVNCYLAKTDVGYILIDTGFLSKRARLEQELDAVGCRPGNLQLILLTHSDTDHADNAAYLRKKYGAKIALHPFEAPFVERGDMSSTRKAKPVVWFAGLILSAVMLRSQAFSKTTAWAGLLGLGLLLASVPFSGYTTAGPTTTVVSAIVAVSFIGGGLLSLAWYILVGRRLLKLGRLERKMLPQPS